MKRAQLAISTLKFCCAVSVEAAAGENFKGFMIQARAGTGAELQLVGTFLQRDGYQTLGCTKQAVRQARAIGPNFVSLLHTFRRTLQLT